MLISTSKNGPMHAYIKFCCSRNSEMLSYNDKIKINFSLWCNRKYAKLQCSAQFLYVDLLRIITYAQIKPFVSKSGQQNISE